MKTDQILSEFQTGICVVVHVTLETEQFISHIRTVSMDTITSLQMHQLLTKIPDILSRAVREWFGNTAWILAGIFNSASGQCHEIWASQFPLYSHF